ncbi:uncharacterized protein [Primulina huaijiensis]|uniref:uncharacterized protein isoform X2 n=1 Tax=Primulina huaijiensis TaxID=1492673 RepID=UPI003CC6EDEF
METRSGDEPETLKNDSAKLNSSLIDKMKSEFYNENGRNTGSDSANATPSDLNYRNEYQHNVSVQTGEEFSPEFLRDRVMSRRNPFVNEVDCNTKNKQCLDVSQNQHHLAYEDVTGHPGSRTSDGSFSGKMKFLCSFSGRIFPRPNDGKLRYVGGETKILSIRKNITYVELMRKTSGICNQAHTIKYQLPGEDLDALISVSSDEDLHHMIEEYHDLERSSQRLRIFLVSSSDGEGSCSLDPKTTQKGDADRYVVAVNGMFDPSHQRSSSRESLASQRGSNLDGSPTIQRDSPSSHHRKEKRSEGSSTNLKFRPSSPASQFLNASYILSPPLSPVRFKEPQNSYIKRYEDVLYHDDCEYAHPNVMDAPGFDHPSWADATGYRVPVIGSPTMGSHLRKSSKDFENLPSCDPSNFNRRGSKNTVRLYEERPSEVSSSYQLRVVSQQRMADENYQVFSHKNCLSQENVNGMKQSGTSTDYAPDAKFVEHKWNLPKIICLPDSNLGSHTPIPQMQGPENPASLSNYMENPSEIHSQPLQNPHKIGTPEIPVIVEDVTDRVPLDVPFSSKAIPHVQDEPIDEIESPGQETETGSVIPESDYDVFSADEDNKDESISDAAIIEMEAGIYGLQIIKNADLEDLHELGSGTFGTVYHGKWRGTDVAIKRIKKSCFAGRSSEQERLTKDFWREAQILSKLHHPNVVAFYGVVPDGPETTLATVTEYMANGSLRRVLLKKERALDRRKKMIIALDAAFGMEYLHLKSIVHFDLKCDNLLVNLGDPHRPVCKVGDFGLSRIKQNTLVSGGVRGTLPWMAPELLNGSSSRVSEKVDVFSFGIAMWEILTGEEPYANMHCGAIIGGIVNNTLRPPIPERCDEEWRNLMEECWTHDPAIRPSFTEITNRLRAMSTALQPKKFNRVKR